MERTFHIPSKLSQIPRASHQILRLIRGNVNDAERLKDIRLCIEEALANAVRHGNQEDPAKKVHIHFSLDETQRRLMITIQDEGSGFKPTLKSPAKGYGLILIRHFMDEVVFNREGNQIQMMKQL